MKQKMRQKIFLGCVGLATFAAAYAFTSDPDSMLEKPPAVVRPVKLFEISDHSQQNIRRFPATIHSVEESQISFRISGELLELPVKKAQLVKKGQLLARLDDRDIKNEVALRQTDFELARNNYQRLEPLQQENFVSQADMDAATTNLKASEVNLKLAKDKLKDSRLSAPFDGRIARIDVENHQLVQSQQIILLLQNSDSLEVRIQIPDTVLSRIQEENIDPGYQPYVTFAGEAEHKYPVTYKEHGTSVTPGTLSYETTFTLPVPDEITVYPGMGATLHMDLSRIFQADDMSRIVVPVTAVLKDDLTGNMQAWVYNPAHGSVNPVEVTVGRITQNGINVLAGLKDGDHIVAAGLSRLSMGMKVKPLTRERGL